MYVWMVLVAELTEEEEEEDPCEVSITMLAELFKNNVQMELLDIVGVCWSLPSYHHSVIQCQTLFC